MPSLPRHKILRAFGEDDTAGTPETALSDYARAFRVIDWVRTTYPDVPDKTRGVVFSDDYVTAVKCLYMDSLIRVSMRRVPYGAVSKLPVLDMHHEPGTGEPQPPRDLPHGRARDPRERRGPRPVSPRARRRRARLPRVPQGPRARVRPACASVRAAHSPRAARSGCTTACSR